MSGFIAVNDSLSSKPVQVCLSLGVKVLREGSILGLQEFFDHVPHPATVLTVSEATYGILAYAFDRRSVLRHRLIDVTIFGYRC